MNGAIECVLGSEFFRDVDNRTKVNRVCFLHDVVSDLAGNQSDISGMLSEDLKRDIAYEKP